MIKKARNRLSIHWVIVPLLVIGNGIGWLIGGATGQLPEVEPILHPDVADVRRHWRAGDAVGETFRVEVTELEAAQTIAWFLAPRDNIPFERPQVTFTPDGVSGRGIATLAGLQVEVYGSGQVWVDQDGRPMLTLQDLGIGGALAPPVVKGALQAQVEYGQQLYDELALPIAITHIEIGDGVAIVEGIYK